LDCFRPAIEYSNILPISIAVNYRNALLSSNGIDMTGIISAMDLEEVPKEDRTVVARKIIAWFTVVNNKQMDKLDKRGINGNQ